MRNKKSSEEDKAIAEEYKKAKVELIEDICSRILKPTEDKDAAKVYNWSMELKKMEILISIRLSRGVN